MFVETLENRRLFAASAIAAAAQARTVDELATSEPGAVALVARPAGPTVAGVTPGTGGSAVAAAAKAGTIADLAQSEPGAVAALAGAL